MTRIDLPPGYADALPQLRQLHADIDTRVQAIRAEAPAWLCGKGCGGCCRRLAAVPQLTMTEWAFLQPALAALPSAQRADITQAMAQLAVHAPRPVTCPLLDQASDACTVYAHRPVACRTYGFYVQRDKGLYCGDIEAQVAAGQWADVVWGNHDAIDQRLAPLGETRALTEWFARWQESAGL